MEITNELRARIFAAYWGCEIAQFIDKENAVYGELVAIELDRCYIKMDDKTQSWAFYDVCQLLLTPLAEITDEDAQEVARIICGRQFVDIENLVATNQPTAKEGHTIFTIKFDAYQIERFKDDKPSMHIINLSNWGTINHYIAGAKQTDLSNNVYAMAVCDYLRSKSYDLGYMNIESLIAAGIAIKK